MADIALLLDEDVRVKLGEILRQRGYDVIQKFARLAQILRHRKQLGLGYSSRQDAKTPSSEKTLFLKTFAP